MCVILGTQEAEIRRKFVRSQKRQIVQETLISKTKQNKQNPDTHTKRMVRCGYLPSLRI
jgi:hypothetical protein